MGFGTLQRYVKAYKKVCSEADPYKTYAILNELERIGIKSEKHELGKILPAEYVTAIDAYLCQIILRSNRRRVNPQIMEWVSGYSSKKISVPYPEAWVSSLEKSGVPICRRGSRILFFYAQLKAWARFFLLLKRHILVARNSYEAPTSPYVVFCGLPSGAIPLDGPKEQNSTVIDWFLREQKIAASHDIVVQTNTVQTVKKQGKILLSPFVLPGLGRNRFYKFILKALAIFCDGLWQWSKGNWKAPYVAAAALDDCYMSLIPEIAKTYYFSNSDFAVRPFWSYTAEKRGADITLYFYSANINCFYEGQVSQSPPPPGYISMSWQNYLVIDQEQKQFLQDACAIGEQIEVAGSIDFSDSDEKTPAIPDRSIALFDISPFNYENVAALALIAPYYTSDMLAEFLGDITECIKELDGHLVWKRKRDVSRHVMAESYDRIVQDMQQDSHITLVSPGISARRILPHVRASISIPFTSTAILAKEMGKDSVFYDPTNRIKYLTGLSRGLPVLGGKDQLRIWMESVLDN